MKVISIWNPYSTLIVHGYKTCETRGWPAPARLVGERLGIASTKVITPHQRAHWNDETFRGFYDALDLPDPANLPRGFLLGTVVIDSVDLITEDLLANTSDEEKSYGWWDVGNFAWRLRDPQMLKHPVPVRGRQGLWDWNGDLSEASFVTKDDETCTEQRMLAG